MLWLRSQVGRRRLGLSLVGRRAVGHSHRGLHAASKGSGLGIVGYDSYEFVVADAERSRKFYTEMLDVPAVAKLDERVAAERGEDATLSIVAKKAHDII